MIILGIESSCDETSAAVLKVTGSNFEILSNVVSSQIEIHKPYGGVVPELAARNHIINILPVIDQALEEAKITKDDIDKIGVTTGPGLITSLIVGTEAAKTIAYSWKKPICSINHMKAHIYANWLENKKINFPAIGLMVSGGHTEIVLMKDEKLMKKIGQTVDDAAGEAFDKVAQLLELGYPGGPIVSKLAENGDNKKYDFPRPMIYDKNYNFSFSGLKTSVLYTVQKIKNLDEKTKRDICASFQQAVIDVLVNKTIKAATEHNIKTVMLCGGVAANKLLREKLEKEVEKNKKSFIVPRFSYCTDNAAMIAMATNFASTTPWSKLKVDPNLEIK